MNRIAKLINDWGKGKLNFVPNSAFYKEVHIGRKRWGQIYRNEKPANIDELARIAKYFGFHINDLIDVESSEVM